MKRLTTSLLAGFVAAFLTLATMVSAQAQEAPDAMIKRVATDVLTTLKSDKDLQAGNKKKLYDLIDTKIAGNFDFTRMTALAMGRSWRTSTPEQQKVLADEFKQLLVRTYSGALQNFSNHVMDFKPLKMTATDTDITVRTTVTAPGGQPISIDYSMEKTGATGGTWKAYDVVVGGVSLVTNYREEFNNSVRDAGVDGLIKQLQAKNRA